MNVSNKLFLSKNNIDSRRAVAPVIATILLVAIAVVGGGMIFAFSEDSHRYLAISNSPQINSLEITGFDARDTSLLILHDGIHANNLSSPGDFDGQAGNGLLKGERIAVYVQNNSISTVYFSEVRFAGSELMAIWTDSKSFVSTLKSLFKLIWRKSAFVLEKENKFTKNMNEDYEHRLREIEQEKVILDYLQQNLKVKKVGKNE